ncbi:MAG: phosphoketolase family protein [Oscillospiraceae bacterium]|nr:phosphoketolase family protein [Oscillospiraceae bacterium]
MTDIERIDAYWRAANYLSAAQLYLLDDPLLRRPLEPADIKKKIVGHWGTCPGQNFIYAHLNRIIKKYDIDMIYVCGPGHGGNAVLANVYLEGSYSEIYPDVSMDEEGLRKLCRQFSFPGGTASHASPETPGSINEGGELGYSLAHAFGAVFDNPGLVAACVIGDGEAETGPLSASWQSLRFLDRERDGRVLPILHLNGYKISNPTIYSRIPRDELKKYLEGSGWKPYFVDAREPMAAHEAMMKTMDSCVRELKRGGFPAIVFSSPKGWTGPKENEGSFRSHQVPLNADGEKGLKKLEQWLKSYRPEELFDENGTLMPELRAMAPEGHRRMGSNPHANGGTLLKELRVPDYRQYGVSVSAPGAERASDMAALGPFVRDIFKLNAVQRNFRVFGPDETMSNRLGAVFEQTARSWQLEKREGDEFLEADGRVMDAVLSEHLCQGWLEGWLLTGRHGFFNSYEAFIRIVDSMASQHAKWLKMCSHIPWRAKIASLNYVLASNVWQQDHNGFTHQDPGFLDHIANKKADVVRMYLPPDANCLLSCFDHCIRSRGYVNVIVASKHPSPQWLGMDQAVRHCAQGIGIWQWASNDRAQEPDIVMACCGDTPTLEILAAVSILRSELPELKIRVVNVVDLFRLQPSEEHPHGLSARDYDNIFTKDKPIIFAFHGYATLVHELTYRRHNKDMHVRGYKEEGTITTPFDMRVQNDLDRFHLVMDAVNHLPSLGNRGAFLIQMMKDKLARHRQYIRKYGEDMPEVREWRWEG